jgi:integral membrane protein
VPDAVPTPSDTAATLRALDRVRVIAVLDAIMLVILVAAAILEAEGVVGILGPIHGAGFVLLLVLTVNGAGQGRWGWWFPLVTLVTTGPPGSLIGDVRIRRALRSRTA